MVSARPTAFPREHVNVGLQKDFYRLQEMDAQTRRWVELPIERMPDARDQNLARGWIRTFQEAFVLRGLLKRGGIQDAEIEEAIEIVISNSEEDMHADTEKSALVFLDALDPPSQNSPTRLRQNSPTCLFSDVHG